jgi:hypothetical protein
MLPTLQTSRGTSEAHTITNALWEIIIVRHIEVREHLYQRANIG